MGSKLFERGERLREREGGGSWALWDTRVLCTASSTRRRHMPRDCGGDREAGYDEKRLEDSNKKDLVEEKGVECCR